MARLYAIEELLELNFKNPVGLELRVPDHVCILQGVDWAFDTETRNEKIDCGLILFRGLDQWKPSGKR